jgi:thioredoxin-related protein
MKSRFLLAAVASAALLAAQASAKTGWVDDFEKGLAQAKAEKKLALVDFTGSDWCVWCQRLDAEIFSKEEFTNYVKDKYVLVEVDFPQAKPLAEAKTKEHNKLSEIYKVEGFPTVLILDPTGKEVGRLGYVKGGPKAFITELEKVTKK